MFIRLFLSLLLVASSFFLGCDKDMFEVGMISGVVSQDGTGVEGVTVELSGADEKETTTDADGSYSFKALKPGDYTVAPSQEFGTSSPVSVEVTLGEECPEVADVDFEIDIVIENPNPGCAERVWKGDFVILSFLGIKALSGFTSITGNLTIVKTVAVDLNGMECLNNVGGNLTITGNALADLDGLDNLTTIGGNLTIAGNTLLSLKGLESLESINGNLTITTNPVLLDIKSLSNLTSVEDIAVAANPSLLSLEGLNGITATGHVGIAGNPSMPNLAGLENLQTVDGFLSIRENIGLAGLGLDALESVDLNLSAVANVHLCTDLVQQLADAISVGGEVVIAGNKLCQ